MTVQGVHKLLFCGALLCTTLVLPVPAGSFMSFPPGKNVHRQIIIAALKRFSVSDEAIRTISRGADSQDNPFGSKWSRSENHSCDNKISQSFAYVDERTNKAVELAERADSDQGACGNALYAFGEGLHSLQDFYSHSNYVEWLLMEKEKIAPIDRTGVNPVPAPIKTCYYFYQSKLKQEAFLSHADNIQALRAKEKNEAMPFHSEEEWQARQATNEPSAALDYALGPGNLLHMELNKDSESQLEGKVECGKDGKTLFAIARDLAIDDTARQWQTLEERILSRYGDRGSLIIKALKGQ